MDNALHSTRHVPPLVAELVPRSDGRGGDPQSGALSDPTAPDGGVHGQSVGNRQPLRSRNSLAFAPVRDGRLASGVGGILFVLATDWHVASWVARSIAWWPGSAPS